MPLLGGWEKGRTRSAFGGAACRSRTVRPRDCEREAGGKGHPWAFKIEPGVKNRNVSENQKGAAKKPGCKIETGM